MNVLVLGGCGIQGRGALYDLSRNPRVGRIVCADLAPQAVRQLPYLEQGRIETAVLDARDAAAMQALMRDKIDVVVDLLPVGFVRPVAEAAIRAGVSLVNTNYAYDILDLDAAARAAGVAILPECGLDPGIDLVIYGQGLRQFDRLEVLNSYCGGIPEPAACTNPLNYKISWNWDTVLKTIKRDGTLIRNGRVIEIAGCDQLNPEWVHYIEFPGLGRLEAFPNGNALRFAEQLGVAGTLRESGRYTLRWPGWCGFWQPIKRLGLLDDTPVPGLPVAVTPHEVFSRWLEPRLQYASHEKDLAVMHNVFIGEAGGRRRTVTYNVLVQRDLTTGLMGMALGVSYPACIAAEMIAGGEVERRGILSPLRDLPGEAFLSRLAERGIRVECLRDP
jgi:saccharopine dehydrogenase-like NADP-dependent oxidoreductase